MEGHQSEENGDYKKMIYRLLPGPNKNASQGIYVKNRNCRI